MNQTVLKIGLDSENIFPNNATATTSELMTIPQLHVRRATNIAIVIN